MANLAELTILINAKTQEDWGEATRQTVLTSVADYATRTVYKGLSEEWMKSTANMVQDSGEHRIKIPDQMKKVIAIGNSTISEINWYEPDDFFRLWSTVSSDVDYPDGWTVRDGYVYFNASYSSDITWTFSYEKHLRFTDAPSDELINLSKVVLSALYPEGSQGAALVETKAKFAIDDVHDTINTGYRTFQRLIPDQVVLNFQSDRRNIRRYP